MNLRLKLVLNMIADEIGYQIDIVYRKLRPIIFLYNFFDMFLHETINERGNWFQLWIPGSYNFELEDIFCVHEIQQQVSATGNEPLHLVLAGQVHQVKCQIQLLCCEMVLVFGMVEEEEKLLQCFRLTILNCN